MLAKNKYFYIGLALGLGITLQSSSAFAFSVFSMNLHGYHPSDEAPRWEQAVGANAKPADSNIFYFTIDEIDRGHRKRLDRLAQDIERASPDILMFQEVGAGSPSTSKDCVAFKNDPAIDSDRFETNSVIRLRNRLNHGFTHYNALLACRGNIGWQTDGQTFSQRRILKGVNGNLTPVFEVGSNPYPQGMIVEGLAILVKQSWQILDSQEWRIPFGDGSRTVFLQMARLRGPDFPANQNLVVVNIHAGWDLDHFEQAIAIRSKIAEYSEWNPVLIGGDFNGTLFRPERLENEFQDPSTSPWEIAVEGSFDYRFVPGSSSDWTQDLTRRLLALNPKSTSTRVANAVNSLVSFQARYFNSAPLLMSEAISTAGKQGLCQLDSFDASCETWQRIDHFFFSPIELTLNQASFLYKDNNWKRLDSLSDHPAIRAEFEVQ